MAELANHLLQHVSNYEPIRLLGRGQRSTVWACRNKKTGEHVAIKFVPRGWEPSTTKYITREILNHQELSLSKHPHIVEFKEVFITSRYLAEVLEYVEGETLQMFLEKVGGKVIEGLARFIFQQLVIALDFCHRKGKVNRDIKLSSILLSIAEGQLPLVKLYDFGVSKDTYRHSEPHSQVGTALFVAPEVMQNFSGGTYDGQAADVWACGVCLFIMLFGRHPYLRPDDSNLSEQQQMIRMFQRLMKNDLEFPQDLAAHMSSDCLDILRNMLRTDPGQRYTMAQIQRHAWFNTALPEGADMMNQMFMAQESAHLTPQSQSQIEVLVTTAARAEEAAMQPKRVHLPSQAGRLKSGSNTPNSGSGGGNIPGNTVINIAPGAAHQQMLHAQQQIAAASRQLKSSSSGASVPITGKKSVAPPPAIPLSAALGSTPSPLSSGNKKQATSSNTVVMGGAGGAINAGPIRVAPVPSAPVSQHVQHVNQGLRRDLSTAVSAGAAPGMVRNSSSHGHLHVGMVDVSFAKPSMSTQNVVTKPLDLNAGYTGRGAGMNNNPTGSTGGGGSGGGVPGGHGNNMQGYGFGTGVAMSIKPSSSAPPGTMAMAGVTSARLSQTSGYTPLVAQDAHMQQQHQQQQQQHMMYLQQQQQQQMQQQQQQHVAQRSLSAVQSYLAPQPLQHSLQQGMPVQQGPHGDHHSGMSGSSGQLHSVQMMHNNHASGHSMHSMQPPLQPSMHGGMMQMPQARDLTSRGSSTNPLPATVHMMSASMSQGVHATTPPLQHADMAPATSGVAGNVMATPNSALATPVNGMLPTTESLDAIIPDLDDMIMAMSQDEFFQATTSDIRNAGNTHAATHNQQLQQQQQQQRQMQMSMDTQNAFSQPYTTHQQHNTQSMHGHMNTAYMGQPQNMHSVPSNMQQPRNSNGCGLPGYPPDGHQFMQAQQAQMQHSTHSMAQADRRLAQSDQQMVHPSPAYTHAHQQQSQPVRAHGTVSTSMMPGGPHTMVRTSGSYGGGTTPDQSTPSMAPPQAHHAQQVHQQQPQLQPLPHQPQPHLVEAPSFLYEAMDDDVPMIGSVSAVMPGFDWNSFNTPSLANLDTLQASQHFQDSRFTQVCRHVSEKWQDGGGVRDGLVGGGVSANMGDDLMDIMQSMQGHQM